MMIVSSRIVATRRCVKPSTSQASRVKVASANNNIAYAYIGSLRMRKADAFRLRASDEDDDATAEESSSNDKAITSMADSLIERAKEATTAGALDDKYVTELETEINQLQDLAKSAQQSADAYEKTLTDFRDKFVRLQADFENFRKRSATEKTNLATSVKGDVVSELLPLIDNFELAGKQLVLETDGEKKVDAAYQGLYKQMVEIFRNLGLEATPGAGEPFDPNVHEAIMRESNEDVPDGTVLEEFRKGFVLGEKLLRPAMVKVSFSDAPVAPAADANTEEDKVAAGADSE